VLTGNDLGRLGNVEQLPDQRSIEEYGLNPHILDLKTSYNTNPEEFMMSKHKMAQDLIGRGSIEDAWKTLLQVLP
jgi:hypothetical protein